MTAHMIRGLGIDAVDVARFIPWVTYSRTRLARIFSADELNYCFAMPVSPENLAIIAQRLAVRFAAREAFFKALSAFHPEHSVPFLTVCRYVAVTKQPSGAIGLLVDWASLEQKGLTVHGPELRVHISATHTATTAFVTVIIESATDRHRVN